MKQTIFAVYDQKAEAYLPPFYQPAVGLAIRAFEEAANTPDHNFAKYPADFSLVELGTFDDNSAKFDIYSVPKSLGLAVEFKRSSENDNRQTNESKLTELNGSPL